MQADSASLSEQSRNSSTARERMRLIEVDTEIQLADAHAIVAKLFHDGPDRNFFRRERVYLIDLCLTPRRADGRYCDHWSPARFVQLGPLIALPPRKRLEFRSPGGRHVSVLCQLQSQAVERWLPEDFVWTERRLEVSLNIANETIKSLMLRLYEEMKRPANGSTELGNAIAAQLAIELARHICAASEADTRGGLASWRLRLVDERIADEKATYPTVAELASLCRLSPRQFSRAFKASRGCPISDFLVQTRIDEAKRRLFSKGAIAEIARSLGFSSQSSFTAAFRRSTGTTPAEFRKQVSSSTRRRAP